MEMLNSRLLKDITSYCELNNLDVSDYINSMLRKAFMLEKYGERPPIYGAKTGKETPVEVVKETKEINYSTEVEIPKKKKRVAVKKTKSVKEEPSAQIEEEVKTIKEENTPTITEEPAEVKENKIDKPKKRKLAVK